MQALVLRREQWRRGQSLTVRQRVAAVHRYFNVGHNDGLRIDRCRRRNDEIVKCRLEGLARLLLRIADISTKIQKYFDGDGSSQRVNYDVLINSLFDPLSLLTEGTYRGHLPSRPRQLYYRVGG